MADMWNDKSELVSVIIPTYKRKNILRAVDSVLNQNYPSIEIIVVDDNSEFPEYRRYIEETLYKYVINNKVRLIQNEKNLGGALARNAGIIASQGAYITFLDDDDWYLQGKIEKQVNVLKTTNANIVYCWSRGEDLEGNILWRNTKTLEGHLLVEAMTECIANTSLIMCKRDKIFEVGLFEDMPCKQDVFLELKFAAAGALFVCVREILVVYGNSEIDFQRISNISKKTLVGMNKVRDYARSQYSKLTRKQIAFVEGDTAYKICNIAKILGDRGTYEKEYKIALRYNHNIKKKLKILYFWMCWKEKTKDV